MPLRESRLKEKDCVCPQGVLVRYQRKISGPIVDRVDLWVEVPQVDHQKLSDEKIVSESSENIRKRVIKARDIQKKDLPRKIKRRNQKGKTSLKLARPDLAGLVL